MTTAQTGGTAFNSSYKEGKASVHHMCWINIKKPQTLKIFYIIFETTTVSSKQTIITSLHAEKPNNKPLIMNVHMAYNVVSIVLLSILF